MTMQDEQKNLVHQRVTYTLELNGSLVVVENVPARVNVETGEQLFSPETVEQLQALVLDSQQSPDHFIQVPVYDARFSLTTLDDSISDSHNMDLELLEITPEERIDLLSRHRSNSENLDRQILTLASSVLGLTLTFIHNVVPIESARYIWGLIGAWMLFVLSIIVTLISFHISQRAIELRLQSKDEQLWGSGVNVANYLSTSSFCIGIFLMVFFVIRNVVT